MQLNSIPFLVFAVLAVVSTQWARTLPRRRFVLLLLNLAFLSTFASTFRSLWALALFEAIAFLSVLIVNRLRSRWIFATCITLIVVTFVYLKQYQWVDFLPTLKAVYVTVGLSYILFRCLHLLIDTYQSAEPRTDLSIVDIANYINSFLTLTAGPIQRYEEFLQAERTWLAEPRVTPSAVSQAISRIVWGYLKLVLIGPALQMSHVWFADRLQDHSLAFSAAMFAHLLYVYVNFSGYMDVVIGLGRLCGFHLPENFNAPWLCASFLDLWNRWHITMSQWFKTYVFNPVIKFLTTRWPNPRMLPYHGVAAYFLVFFLLGLWHGSGNRYLLLGLALGLGASVNKLWEVELRRRLGRARHQQLTAVVWYRSLARAMALTWFAFAAIASWNLATTAELFQVLTDVGLTGVCLNLGFCILAIAALDLGSRAFMTLLRGDAAHVDQSPVATLRSHVLLSAKIVLLIIVVVPGNPWATADSWDEKPPMPKSSKKSKQTTGTEVFYGNF